MSGVPADVAALLSSAGMEQLPYKDFSAERREHRAVARHQAALVQRDAEALAKASAEQAAAAADRAAQQAAETANIHAAQAREARLHQLVAVAAEEEAERERALAQAEQWSRQAAAERSEAARRAQALRTAEAIVRREEAEVVQARAALAAESGVQLVPAAASSRLVSGPTTEKSGPRAEVSRSVLTAEPPSESQEAELDDLRAERIPLRQRSSSLFLLGEEADALIGVQGAPLDSSAAEGVFGSLRRADQPETVDAVEVYAHALRMQEPSSADVEQRGSARGFLSAKPFAPDRSSDVRGEPDAQQAETEGQRGSGDDQPAWLAGRGAGVSRGKAPTREALQDSRDRATGRWFALHGFLHPSAPASEREEALPPEQSVPLLAIYSVAGGVGKTSLAASLTRALAAQGERVLLVDTTERGLLPFYLGARTARPSASREFAPPAGSTDQPIRLLSDTGSEGQAAGDALAERLRREAAGFSRVVVDVASGASGIVQSLAEAGADILVPVTGDMNSVISLPSVQRDLAEQKSASGREKSPAYLLVQFDPAQSLQLDIREVLRQRLGDMLLPFAVRRSPAVAEALAEGMTVIDYAPGDGVAKDVLQLAAWLRASAEPAREGLAQARWSERR